MARDPVRRQAWTEGYRERRRERRRELDRRYRETHREQRRAYWQQQRHLAYRPHAGILAALPELARRRGQLPPARLKNFGLTPEYYAGRELADDLGFSRSYFLQCRFRGRIPDERVVYILRRLLAFYGIDERDCRQREEVAS